MRRPERPSLLSVVGTSAMRMPRSEALITISLANSMPVVRRSMRRKASAVKPRDAAVEVADRDAEEQPADQRQRRVADVAVLPRHRAGAMPPWNRLPMTRSLPCAQPLDEGVQVGEVVAVVGVGHDDPRARAPTAIPPEERRAVAALRDRTTRAPRSSAISCEPSVLPLSATRTSPSSPTGTPRASPSRCTCRASRPRSRHGIRMVRSGMRFPSGGRGGGPPGQGTGAGTVQDGP